SYMVPSAFVVIDEVPLTPQGKVDRRALPKPDLTVNREYVAPTGVAEEVIAAIFAEVLGVEQVSVADSFFELGGNSLMATRVIARVNESFGTELIVRELFEAPTVSSLAKLTGEPDDGVKQRVPLVRQERPDEIPLSLAQQRMWFINQFDPASPAYNIPLALRLTGTLDTDALQRAYGDVVGRHETLRTVYPGTGNGPVQQILDAERADATLLVQDVADENELQQAAAAFAMRGFDVSVELPVRGVLYRLSDNEHVLVIVLHHVSADGSSMMPMAKDVMLAYTSRLNNSEPMWAPLEVQYADFALWQRQVLGDPADDASLAARQIRFWQQELADLPDLLELPTDKPRPAAQTLRGGRIRFEIPVEVHRALASVSADRGATVFMATHAAFAVLLSRLSGSDDIAVGTPIAGRGSRALDELIGMFVNTLVLRTRVEGNATFADLVDHARDHDLAAFTHADVPFEQLVEVLNPARSTAYAPLAQVGFSFHNLEKPSLQLPDLVVEPLNVDTEVAQYDLHLVVSENLGDDGELLGLSAGFTFAEDLFLVDTVQRIAERFVDVLRVVSADPSVVVGDINILDEAETQHVVHEVNNTAGPVVDRLLTDFFDEQAAAHPDSAALVFGDTELTYAEFSQQVNALARYLISEGVGVETTVGLAAKRSIELLVGMYAIVKAGGAYLPIDPDHPAERTAYVLESAQPTLVLSTSREALDLPAGVRRINMDALDLSETSTEPVTQEERSRPLTPDNIAYVIYTSGSTGRPKGVAVPHAAIANQIAWKISEYPMQADSALVQKTPATFDLSVWEFWWPLAAGARLIIADPDGHRDPAYLANLMRQHSVTDAHFVPSLLDAFLAVNAGEDGTINVPSLQRILCIGEALGPATARSAVELTEARVDNLYGPTEAAVSITSYRCTGSETATMPIGVPETNSQVYVLDRRLRPVPPGVTGELYLAGAQLARGYFGRADLTSDRFVANIFGAAGTRMYRTGDLARWRSGVLEYMGRSDFQVKVRGFRIELGEIENALVAQPPVEQAAVIVHTAASAGEQLVAYVVGEGEINTDAFRIELGKALPSYMVPSVFLQLPQMPLNVNGKLDRKALPEPEIGTHAGEFVAPRNPVEEIIAGVFGEVLGTTDISVTADFFEAGGNSLLATRVVARIAAALNVQLPVRVLFDYPTVEALASYTEHHATSDDRPPLRRQERPENIPLSLAQQRMWFINQFDSSSGAYNIPLALRLTGELDVDALIGAVTDTVVRHETLRTIYPSVDGAPVQRVLAMDDVHLDVPVVAVDENSVLERIVDLVNSGFDVATELPARGTIFQLKLDEHIVVLVLHHISADGSSMGPLARDIMVAYHARVHGDTPMWQPLDVQYADYALWQRNVLGDDKEQGSLAAQQLQYWTDALAALPDRLELPTDYPRPAVQSMRGATHEFTIPAELREQLVALARQNNATTFMVVHTALAMLLARLSRSDDLAIGTPVAGRGDRALDGLVGMFVNTLVLRTQLDGNETFAQLLGQHRNTDLNAFTHADVPFERLVDVLQPERSTAHSPLFQVILSFENLDHTEFELDGLTIAPLDSGFAVAKYDLQFTFAEAPQHDGAMRAAITYATDLFAQSTIEQLTEQFIRLCTTIVEDPHRNINDYTLLSDEERAELTPVSGAPAEPPQHLSQMLRDTATTHAEAPALVFNGETVSYGELHARSNQLARELLSRGITPETPVAVSIARSIDSVVALWAVVKIGATFVPIDPTYPEDRIAHMVSDSGVEVVLTHHEHARIDLTNIILDDPAVQARIADRPDTELQAAELGGSLSATQAAYMIYTSGSTGLPKGVVVTHTGLANYAAEQQERFGINSSSRVLHFSSPSFDASMLELFLAIPSGACMCVAPAGIYGGEELASFLNENDVTHAFVATAALGTVPPQAVSTVRTVIVGGEAVPDSLVTRWASERAMFNAYGPTEATIAVTMSKPLVPHSPVVIGGPIRGTNALVLDNRLQPIPVGVPGELYVSGAGLARGYHRRAGTTAERFVANPTDPNGGRLYRTGDIVKWVRDTQGELELTYVGRADFQVKVRGFRIELGEIDVALTNHDAIAHAMTVAHKGASNQTQLVSYVVPEVGVALEDVSPEVLREFAGETLPSYMVPAAIMPIAEIPLTPNGKVNKKALPEPVFASTATTQREPSTEMERAIASLVSELLGVATISVDDSFFSLGGDSIMSIQLVARAKTSGIVFAARDVFEQKTIAGLARVAQWSADSDIVALEELEGGGIGEMPPLPVMQWLTELGGDNNEFSQAMLLTLPREVDQLRLERTLAAVVAHHDALRLTFVQDGDHTHVSTAETIDIAQLLRRVEFTEPTDSADFAELAAAEHDAAAARLAPTNGIVVQFVWFAPSAELPDESGRLLIMAHHLAVDGVSWRILLPDLATAWAQLDTNETATLQPVGTSLRRWAHALTDYAHSDKARAELQYWSDVVSTTDEPLGSDEFHPHKHTIGQLDRVDISVPADIGDKVLNALPHAYRANVNDGLLAALFVALQRYQQRQGRSIDSILVAMEGHGREEALIPGADLSRTVGWFTNVYPARLSSPLSAAPQPSHLDELSTLLKAVKEQFATIPNKGMGYGALRYLNTSTADQLVFDQPPQVTFNYLGRLGTGQSSDTTQTYGWLPDGSIPGVGGTANDSMGAPGALNINVSASGDELTGTLSYIRTLFTADQATQIRDEWITALREIAQLADAHELSTLTPSDLPLVDLQQTEIEHVERGHRAKNQHVDDIWSLGPLQHGLLFHGMLAGEGPDVYTAQTVLNFGGTVDPERMRSAGQALLNRYPNLRVAFAYTTNGQPIQTVLNEISLPWQHTDLSGLPLAQAREQGAEIQQQDQHQPFNFADAPLMRMHLVTIAEGEYQLLFTNHHILLDGWSMPILIKELLTLYATRGDATYLPSVRPYKDFLSWIAQQDTQAAKQAWESAFAGVDEPTAIAADGTNAPLGTVRETVIRLSEQENAALIEQIRPLGVTLNTVVQVAWGIVLGQQLGRDDVVFGATVSGRPPQLSGVENMVGLFINTIPTRVQLHADDTLATVLTRVQREQADLMAYHHIALPEIQQLAGPGAHFDTLTVFESYPVDAASDDAVDIDGMTLQGASGADDTHYPVSIIAYGEPTLTAKLKYQPAHISDSAAHALADRLKTVIASIAGSPSVLVRSVELLSLVERELVLAGW
ncbi:amino acid adenylation domain-containing protein, partial [Hoyosella rhizosphaerae]